MKQKNMTTNEILSHIEDCGGFNNFVHWNKAQIATWVRVNYPCSRYVANNVAFYLNH